ncbi:pyroglutamyl-peptidase I [Isoptericola aurantiacus]|uniref:pyroglutamyl-peptidase I n=1 Tax=Isoptericola aurantiacus TaxID=3377839 RepID=UPI00383A5E03
MKVLLTGFEPFGGDTVNESWEAVRGVPSRIGPEVEVVTACLPVTFAGAAAECRHLLDRHAPDAVIAVGLAAGTDVIRLERVAVNVVDARIPDNDGLAPVDVPVVPGGPAAYFSTLPLKASLTALRDVGLPVAVSNTAGTYVCNALFYELQHALAERSGVPSGFVHVPRAEVVDGTAAAEGLRVVVEATARVARGDAAEPRTPAGLEH